MKNLTILATAFALLVCSSACKKDTAGKDTAAASGSVNAATVGSQAAKEAPPKETGVKISKKQPTVGAKHTEETKSEMSMKLTLAGKVNELQQEESSKKDEEVLELSNNAITKLKVTFAEDSKSMAEGGKPAKAKPSALAGKTYIVQSKDGKVVVLNDKDKPAPKAEATLVEKQYSNIGKPNPMLNAMPDRALKEGEEVPELSEAIVKEMQSQSHGEKIAIEGAKVVFVKKDGDNGIFDATMTMKGGDVFKMSVALKGTIAIRIADGWPATMKLEGPLTLEMTEKDKKAGVEGGGTIKIASTYSYK